MKQEKIRRAAIGIFCFGALFNTAIASTPQNEAETKIGDSAQSWFALQASGHSAAVTEPMSGVQASAAYARYLKSFDIVIPERFGSSIKEGISRDSSN
ncbi:lipoprotein [Caballeronia peredens]|nr:lipoprotein [Caballeronia peredens]